MLDNPAQIELLSPKRVKALAAQNEHRRKIAQLCDDLQIVRPEAEYLFCMTRQWRFDWAWPIVKIAIEIEGSVLCGGRHTSVAGFLNDMQKYNTAASLGWIVLRASTLPRPIYSKPKISKRTGVPLPRKQIPWLALDDPEFRRLLLEAFKTRNGFVQMEVSA